MIVGSGIDIAEVPRIRQSIARFGDRFLHRIYTEGEIRYCDSKANRVERYAARFAAKEAAMKALGTGWSHGVRWRDCEVARMPGGRHHRVSRKSRRHRRQARCQECRALAFAHRRASHRTGHSRKLNRRRRVRAGCSARLTHSISSCLQPFRRPSPRLRPVRFPTALFSQV